MDFLKELTQDFGQNLEISSLFVYWKWGLKWYLMIMWLQNKPS